MREASSTAPRRRWTARRHAEEALELARRSGTAHRETLALGNLAQVVSHGSRRQAQARLEQYQALAREHGYQRELLSADFDTACLLRRDGRDALAALRLAQLLTASMTMLTRCACR